MIPAVVVFFYLAVVLAIGLVAQRASARNPDAEDFFLAGRSLGPAISLFSLLWIVPAPPPGAFVSILAVGGSDVITRAASGTMVLGLLPVVPMTLISALLIVVVSKLTPASRPGAATLARYF